MHRATSTSSGATYAASTALSPIEGASNTSTVSPGANDAGSATGTSTTHVGALADEADFQLGREGVNVLRTEGHDGNRWVLLDYGSVIVHVFTPEAHDFYDLEHLWADAKELPAEEWEEKPEEQA